MSVVVNIHDSNSCTWHYYSRSKSDSSDTMSDRPFARRLTSGEEEREEGWEKVVMGEAGEDCRIKG